MKIIILLLRARRKVLGDVNSWIEPVLCVILHHLLLVRSPKKPLKSLRIFVTPSPCSYVQKLVPDNLYFSTYNKKTMCL